MSSMKTAFLEKYRHHCRSWIREIQSHSKHSLGEHRFAMLPYFGASENLYSKI